MVVQELTEKETLIERAICNFSFLRFIRYVRIVEPPTKNNPGGVIQFQLWDHIKLTIKTFLEDRLIVLLKARQIGISWLIAAYVTWYALSHEGAVVILFSKGELEASELLSKCRRIYNHLPDFLRLKLGTDSATEMAFPTMNSSIKALAATETAGIGYTASIYVCDEWDEHPYADANFFSAKPTIDAGGQFIGVFTASNPRPDTLAKSTFKQALEGTNGFTPLFFPWWVRPERSKEWYDKTRTEIPERELARLSPEIYMLRNYPASVEEALRPAQSMAAFDAKILKDMETYCKQPVLVSHNGIDPNIAKIYLDYHIGEHYIAGSDTGHGIGRDFSVTTIMNVQTGTIVADIMRNDLSPEEFALHSVSLLGIYHNPLWYPEANEWGRVTISKAQDIGYKNFGYYDDKKTKVGFLTTDKSRFDLWGSLIPAINNRQIMIFNRNGLLQFYDIIRNIEKEGRIEALPGRHDDYPMAVGIGWSMRKTVNISGFKSEPIETLTFRSQSNITGWKDILRTR